jgi:plastocyanin
MKTKLGIATLTIALLTIATLLGHAQEPVSAKAPTNAAEITIDNFTFTPGALTVKVGTKITWKNRDDVPHVIMSTDNIFRSKALDTDDQFSFTPTKPGTYEYFCSIHPKMTGKLIVQ